MIAPTGCSTAPALHGFVPTGNASSSGSAQPGSGDEAGAPGTLGGTCGMPAAAPSGAGCACHFTTCHGCALECDCAANCYESSATCLVTVDSAGTPHTSDPLLSTGTLSCSLHPAVGGEIPMPAQMVCTETDCTTGPPAVPDAGGDASPSSPEAGSTPPPTSACPVPVPGPVVLPGPVWGEYQVHFYVPFPSYAFAAAHASLAMNALGAYALRETPSAFFATALKESYMGCSDKLPPYNAYMPGYLYTRTLSYASGCLQIDSTSAWVEMCQMYPETIDCNTVTYADVIPSTNQDTTGRDNFASSVWVKAYYDVWSYGMLITHAMPSPGAWFAGASDPQAMVKVMALLYNEGAWTGDATTVSQGCQHDLIENCLGNKDYVFSVGSYTAQLEATVAAGNCYNDMVQVSDVDDYVSRIAPLFVHENAAALVAAGRQAFLTASGGAMSAPFQKVAGAVIQAIDAIMQAKLHCPNMELGQYYMLHCPAM